MCVCARANLKEEEGSARLWRHGLAYAAVGEMVATRLVLDKLLLLVALQCIAAFLHHTRRATLTATVQVYLHAHKASQVCWVPGR